MRLVSVAIEGRVLPFSMQEAELAAELFNNTGRKRGTHADCMIAANVILAGHDLVTANEKDFGGMSNMGLKIRSL